MRTLYSLLLTLSVSLLQALTPPESVCEIYDLSVETGACNPNANTYVAIINFQVQNPGANTFSVWANGTNIGSWSLSALPLTIQNFPYNGGVNDYVKVCMDSNTPCCKEKEFPVPACILTCDIVGLTVTTGNCHPGDSTYVATIDFDVTNPTTNSFKLWGNNVLLGTYPLSALPLTINNFHWNGGPNDVVKVCILENPNCCEEKEFVVPACMQGGVCEIYDLTVTTGDCHPGDSTYVALINFQVENPTTNSFKIWANNTLLGTYPLSALPLLVNNFPWNGGPNDVVKVCILENPNCCKEKEFVVPACMQGGACEIFNLTATPGDCHPADSTYALTINFEVENPTASTFSLWGNNVNLGVYPLNMLPLTIQNFPWDGNGPNDVVKVCISDTPNCCKIKEFAAPNCFQNTPCEIYDLTVLTGDCNPDDSTYTVKIDFEVANTTNALFEVWGNGQYLGFFPLSSLPLVIEHFPFNGGPNDVIKVCINDNPNCCKVKEFAAPDCFQSGNCKIYDLVVKKTPCLCGKFFALVQFEHQNGGSDGFDITGNGVNYGNYSYNTPQPIILGPLVADGTTEYEFVVKDHNHPNDCNDFYVMGKVECPPGPSGVTEIEHPGKVTCSPNPATDWLMVSAQWQGVSSLGAARLELFSAEGRLLQNRTIPSADSFKLDISTLDAGAYQLMLYTDYGSIQGRFIKQ